MRRLNTHNLKKVKLPSFNRPRGKRLRLVARITTRFLQAFPNKMLHCKLRLKSQKKHIKRLEANKNL